MRPKLKLSDLMKYLWMKEVNFMGYQSALKNVIMSKIVTVLQVDLHNYQFLKLVLIFEGEQIFINSRNVLSKDPRKVNAS